MTNQEIAERLAADHDSEPLWRVTELIESALNEAEQRGLRNALASQTPVAEVVTHSPESLAYARIEAKIEALEWTIYTARYAPSTVRDAITHLRAELEKLK